MNTYYITQRFSGYKDFIIEAESEDEAISQVENGYEDPEYIEEDDWETPEVTSVEYGAKEYTLEVQFTIESTSDDTTTIRERVIDKLEVDVIGWTTDLADDKTLEVKELHNIVIMN